MREYSITRKGQAGISADDETVMGEIAGLSPGTYIMEIVDGSEDELHQLGEGESLDLGLAEAERLFLTVLAQDAFCTDATTDAFDVLWAARTKAGRR